MGVCRYLQICNSVLNMVVMGLVLGQSLMVVPTECYPLMSRNIFHYVLLLVTCKVNCLQTFEHISVHWAIKVYVFVKFHIVHIY